MDGSAPQSSLGYLVQGLAAIKNAGGVPFTVMSCDNLQGNGHLAKKLTLEYARLLKPDLADWIEANVSFPNSMVDRITPATTPAFIAEVAESFGIQDEWPVVAEDFT